ncbi:hypothetical protein L7F22_052137 [Adiantum nelumboides]|nr:hypothetical protein [Adiantum nelumboides]
MLASLQHENAMQFIGACSKPLINLVWCIVTEYAKGSSFSVFLARRPIISFLLALKYVLHVAKGMEYLHSFGGSQRDLKSDNQLIANKSIKKADFRVTRLGVQTEGTTL